MYIKLFENFVDLSKNSTLTKKQFLEIIEENCSDFKWSDRPIYRSIKSNQLYLYQNAWDHPKTYTHEKENIDQFDASVVNRMRDILIECGLIGTGTIEDLKSSKYFENQPVFVWTNDEVKISNYQKPSNNY